MQCNALQYRMMQSQAMKGGQNEILCNHVNHMNCKKGKTRLKDNDERHLELVESKYVCSFNKLVSSNSEFKPK
jgi:hypothetical protein